MDKYSRVAITAALCGLVAACGGDDEDSASFRTLPMPPTPSPGTPATGRFVDSAVQGLSYTCGMASGLTNASGEFGFLVGERCAFSVGGVELGAASALGTAGSVVVLTPPELVSGAQDETDPTVSNIARLLLSLDSDSDPANGIVISDSVRGALAGATLNVRAAPAAFAPAAQTVLDTVLPGRTLFDPVLAAAHLKATLLGLFDGAYDCGYVGFASGAVTLRIESGVITGSGTDDESGASFQVDGTLQSSGAATLGSTGSGATFAGSFAVAGFGSGTWRDSGGSGSWQCVRV